MKRLLLAATAVVAAANPHPHKHRHLHNLNERDVTTTDVIATATVYEITGTQIPKDQACAGVAEGKYTWRNPADASVCASPPSAAATSAAASSSAAAATPSAGQFFGSPNNSGAGSGQWTGWTDNGGSGVNAPFPDGTLDCSTFPSAYGAMSVNYLNMGGWIGLQNVGDSAVAGGAIGTINTLLSGDGCREGVMCSYACPAGYTKTQWPAQQGANGESVGGLACSGGKLRLTNPSYQTLCMAGAGGVQAQNNAGGVVSICRTDYPGTESETVPVAIQPGSTSELNCPDAATAYKWQGKDTSAQYYLNPIGVGPEQACQWGDGSQPIGNWAPINFGVGKKDGKVWLSMFQNKPTTFAKYQGKVELQGDLSDKCYYQNGMFYGATGANADGCTVSLPFPIHSFFTTGIS
jgi:SUN family beta-glucosidase